LCQSESDLNALTFSSAKFIEDAVPEVNDIGQFQSALDRPAIVPLQAGKESKVRCAALLNNLLHREVEGYFESLRNQRNQPRGLRSPQSVQSTLSE
jgi:hypothetical protein